MKVLVTGCAGFIGSHCVDRLLRDGHDVIGVDDFSTGHRPFLEGAMTNPRFHLYEKDLTSPKALDGVLHENIDWVVHLAANADVRDGMKHPTKDLEQNIQATLFLLEAMRKAGVKKIVFSSTGSVYGDTTVIPSPEQCPFPQQTSLYGTSKLAAEGLISSYAEGLGFTGLIFRFVSILGERYTHGHVFDFIRQLKAHPESLTVLGNGKQRKSYLYVGDCIEAIMTAISQHGNKGVQIFNLGADEYVEVTQSIEVICETMKLRPKLTFGSSDRGWPGDNPFIFLDCEKIRALGWKPSTTIRNAVQLTTKYLLSNPWVLEGHQ